MVKEGTGNGPIKKTGQSPKMIPGICKYLRLPDYVSKVPPASSHWALLISRNPCPLHALRPLQLLLAVLQELWPLHELAPIHLPLWLLALAVIGAVASIAAAATASAAPVVFLAVIIVCLSSLYMV